MATTPEPGISWAEGNSLDEWVWSRLLNISSPESDMAYRVFKSFKSGCCSLYNLYEDDERVGFCVVRGEDVDDGKNLHIWVLYHEGSVDPMEAHSDFFDDMARSIRANRITFSTNRLGWIKLAPKYGFKLREVVFSREVT